MSSAHSTNVLDLLGRVRLGAALSGEELEEVAVAALQPVVAVVLRPPFRGVQPFGEGVHRAVGMRRRQGNLRSQEDQATDPIGTIGGYLYAPQRPAGQADEHGVGRIRRVEHGERVGGELEVAVGLRLRGPVRAAAAPAVERHDPEVPGEVGHLGLPEPRVDDRPRRQQDDRRLAVAELLPVSFTPSRST